MTRLARISWILATLVGGCFSPTGTPDASSGTTTGTGPSTGAPTPTTGAQETTGTTGAGTSSTGETTTGVVGTTGTADTTGMSSETGSTGASETTMTESGVCGDDELDKGELCDDGNTAPGDGCGPDCKRDALFVFVSSEDYSPLDLSSPEKADGICTDLAAKGQGVPQAARGSKFVAWLSYDEPNGQARERIPYSQLEYRVTHPSLAVVFDDTDDIIDQTPLHAPIRYTEHGVEIVATNTTCYTDAVWTGTTASGMRTDQRCINWSTDDMNMQATAGRAGAVDPSWTAETTCYCVAELRIYCFEAA